MEPDIAALARYLESDARVRSAYVFGSRSRGESRPASDLDIAICIDGAVSLEDELRIRAELQAMCRDVTVDLVILDRAPPLVRYEVITCGRRLFARDDAAADDFERRAIIEYFDTEYLRQVQQRLQKEAVG